MSKSAMSKEAGPPGGSGEAEPHLAKLLIDFGPLVVFFATYYFAGIYWGTGVLMAATVVALIASRVLLGRFSVPPMVTAGLVVVFGGLTIWLRDPSFVMMKPTIINVIFAAVLGYGVLTGRPLLKLLMGEAFKLTDEGWQKLTLRWIGFFLAMALLNEIVWRTLSESTWVTFKVVGILPLTVLFAIAQVGLIKRYEAKTEDSALP